MGASESTLSSPQSQRPIDDITTVSYKSESVDPILENIKSLKITTPILTSPPPTESSLTDILVRRSSTSSASGTVNPKVLLELFSMYRDWQEEKAKQISKRQVCIADHKFWECKTNSINMDGYAIKIVKANVQLRSAVDPYEFHMRSFYFCT